MRSVCIDHETLPVRDLERTLEFYCGRLGCTLVDRSEYDQKIRPIVQLGIGDQHIHIWPTGEDFTVPPETHLFPHLCLEVADVDLGELADGWRAEGLRVSGPHNFVGAKGYGPGIYVWDPDGHIVELKLYA
jgi:catechol 2,3-dioxygenase-like lactoylglutathione lyase family enzyme